MENNIDNIKQEILREALAYESNIQASLTRAFFLGFALGMLFTILVISFL